MGLVVRQKQWKARIWLTLEVRVVVMDSVTVGVKLLLALGVALVG